MITPNTIFFLSRSAIKYAVNIYQALPNNTSRLLGGRMLTEHDHWCFWSLPDLTICYHPSDLSLPLPCETFTRAPPRDTPEQLYTPIMNRVEKVSHTGVVGCCITFELNTRSEAAGTVAHRTHTQKGSARWPASGMAFRLIKQNDKMVIWMSNGEKITRWPIKYPPYKKNAQLR